MQRKAEFHVPSDVMAEFAEELTNFNLKGTITGTTEDSDVILEVEYEKEETSQVDKLEAILETLKD